MRLHCLFIALRKSSLHLLSFLQNNSERERSDTQRKRGLLFDKLAPEENLADRRFCLQDIPLNYEFKALFVGAVRLLLATVWLCQGQHSSPSSPSLAKDLDSRQHLWSTGFLAP